MSHCPLDNFEIAQVKWLEDDEKFLKQKAQELEEYT